MRKDFERAHVTRQGSVAVLTMNHPEVMNAVSAKMIEGLVAALEHIDASSDVRAVILTGEGKGFCSGANLSDASARASEGPRDAGAPLETAYHPLLRRFRNMRVPLITAVNGAAAGVGMSFALMGDLIIAARSAYFLQAFSRIGLVPDGGSTWLLPRLVGLARARELSLLAERLPAEKALEWGLINRVSEDGALMDDALALANRLADGPTRTYSLIRRLYWETTRNSFEEQLDLERWSQRQAGLSDDFIEGVTAFLQKRPAKFQGK